MNRISLVFLIISLVVFSSRAIALDGATNESTYKSPQLIDGYYYASASVLLPISSSLGRKVALKEAGIKAIGVLHKELFSTIWIIPQDVSSYEKLILKECEKSESTVVNGLAVVSESIEGKQAHTMVRVPASSVPSKSDRTVNALKRIRSLAQDDKLQDPFLLYELNLLGTPQESLASMLRELTRLFGADIIDPTFRGLPLNNIPEFYNSYNPIMWEARYPSFDKSQLLSMLQFAPFFNDLCFYSGKSFLEWGYPKTAKLFFQSGAKFEFQSKYYKLCRKELGLTPKVESNNSHNGRSLLDFIVSTGGGLPILNDPIPNQELQQGINSFRDKKFQDALDTLISSLNKNFNSETLNYIGRILEEMGREQEAIPLFRQALKGNPLNEYAMTNLAHTLFKTGNVEQALGIKRELLLSPKLNKWCRQRLNQIDSSTPTGTVPENQFPSNPKDFLLQP